MKTLFASIVLLAACGSDPLDPGAGSNPGDGTRTLFIDGRAAAEPRFSNAKLATDFTTEISIRIGLHDQAVTTGSVTVESRFGTVPLTWSASDGGLGEWTGTMPNYDEVYLLDIVSGADEVRGVIVDGPDIHWFTEPMQGATLDSTMQNPITWDRGETAELTSFDAEEIDRITIDDTGSYMMGAGMLKADRDQVRENRLEVRRTNRVTPAGAVGGSTFEVAIENELTVLAAPNPAL
jgi:hypothetical protein